MFMLLVVVYYVVFGYMWCSIMYSLKKLYRMVWLSKWIRTVNTHTSSTMPDHNIKIKSKSQAPNLIRTYCEVHACKCNIKCEHTRFIMVYGVYYTEPCHFLYPYTVNSRYTLEKFCTSSHSQLSTLNPRTLWKGRIKQKIM